MAKISVERAHSLGKEAAREEADKLAKSLMTYGLEPQWSGDVLNLKRSGVKARCLLAMTRFRVDVELGLMMSAMSGMIKPRSRNASIKRWSESQKIAAFGNSYIEL